MGWQTSLLAAIGAPVTPANVSILSLWAQSEGMPGWENNWLATTLTCCTGVSVNGAGVKVYPSVALGVQATADALLENAYGYPAIVAGFRGNLGGQALYVAINASTWCRGCQTGHYPVALWQAIGGSGGGPAPTPVTSGAQAQAPVTPSTQWDAWRSWLQNDYFPVLHTLTVIAQQLDQI